MELVVKPTPAKMQRIIDLANNITFLGKEDKDLLFDMIKVKRI